VDHTDRQQAEQEQVEEQPTISHQVGGEHTHMLRAVGDDRGDTLGGLRQATAESDGLVE
jgi:hypothetical protein